MELAGHLPGLAADAVARQTLSFRRGNATLDVAVPVLDEAQIAALAARVREAQRSYLKTLSVAQIVDILDRAVARLLDRSDPYRQKMEKLLPVVTGYDAEMVRLGLTGYLKTFRAPGLKTFLAEDFANPAVLDDFQPAAKGGFVRALGPELLVHVWAGNVPGLPLWSLAAGLLVKAGSIGKVASGEPLFAGWFAQLLAEIDPKLGACLAVVWWKGGDAAREAALLGRADVVLAYGGNASLEQVRAHVPATTRFLPFGHKIGFAMVGRSALDARHAAMVARRAAWDAMRYDQQGCYAPQAVFVERGGRTGPRAFAGYLAHELDGFERKFPRRALSVDEASALAAWRGAAEMACLNHPGREVLSDPAGAWCVAYQEDAEDLGPGCLNRTLRVIAVDSLDDAVAHLAPFRSFLQTVGIAAAPEELHRLAGPLAGAGVPRICALGEMTAPEAGWHHDGRFSLLDLVTMSEIDRSALASAEDFAPYAD